MLHMIQARQPALVGRPFFARYDPAVLPPGCFAPIPVDQCPRPSPGAVPWAAHILPLMELNGQPQPRQAPAMS